MKLKTQLYVGFGSILGLVLLLVVVLGAIQDGIYNNVSSIIDRYEREKLVSNVRTMTDQMERGLPILFLESDPDEFEKQLNQIRQARANMFAALDQLETNMTTDVGRKMVAEMRAAVYVQEDYEKQIVAKLKDNNIPEAALIYQQEWDHFSHSIYPVLDKIRAIQEQAIVNKAAEAERSRVIGITLAAALAVITLLVSLKLTLWVTRSVTHRLRKVSAVMEGIADGGYESIPRLEMSVKDEIGGIAVTFNHMAEALERHNRQEKLHQSELEEDVWQKNNIAEITTGLHGCRDITSLAGTFLMKTAPVVGACYAVCFVREENGDLVQAASYAYNGAYPGKERMNRGEGLVGQCAADGQPIRLSSVPRHYYPIQSGLGAAAPGHLLLLPSILLNEVNAVVEFATFEEMGRAEYDLLTALMSTFGIMLSNVCNQMRVERLLGESQQLSGELQSQAEALQCQAEELQLQQEELRTTNEQLEVQIRNAEQRRLELELVQSALEQKANEMELVSNYKSEFLANMSHELRTPLNSLLILAQLLAENREGNLTDRQKEYARTIHSSGGDLLLLINDVLDLAKVEAGKLNIQMELCPVSAITDHIRQQFQLQAERKNLALVVFIQPGTPPSVYSDRGRLEQIMNNLVGNAVKFTDNGSVCVSVYMPGPSEIMAAGLPIAPDQIIAFAVEDTGIGIAPDKQKLVFEAFQQADGSTSRSFGGTGLGLSISRQLAELLGGRITLVSEVGVGSRFTLYVPLSESAHQAGRAAEDYGSAVREAAASAALPRRSSAKAGPAGEESNNVVLAGGENALEGRHVLVVDDDIRNVFALTTLLEGQGMKVTFAENGKEAIDRLVQGETVDLVLMDIMMPKMDGYETMREIRGKLEFAGLPIVALTAKAMKNDRDKCMEAGASDYISKPIQSEQLLSLIRVWLYRA